LESRNVDNYLLRSAAYEEMGEYVKTIADCNQALRLDSNLAEAYNNRGVAYRDKGDYDRAIADYNEALRLNPNYVDAYHIRGIFFAIKGDYDALSRTMSGRFAWPLTNNCTRTIYRSPETRKRRGGSDWRKN
jgi:tetratricopeptide (TPR) repeat protein